MSAIYIFALGYIAIIFERPLRLDKAAIALLTGVLCWTAHITTSDVATAEAHLTHHLGNTAQILFFLLAAMTIVELIDAHNGFELITKRISTRSRRKLLFVLATLSFVLSSVLDNLTTAIVMISLARKLTDDENDRMTCAGVIVISCNAGGVWSPIGDVTTTMLWTGRQITTWRTIVSLIVPAIVCTAVPLVWMIARVRGTLGAPPKSNSTHGTDGPVSAFDQGLALFGGITVLLFVPVFKTLTHLPPVMGILLGLGALWTVMDLAHKKKADESKEALSVSSALQRIDTPSVLFFLGILLAIGALESNGMLGAMSRALTRAVSNTDIATLWIGLASSIVDNVPLVAAAQGMYPLTSYPTDHTFWFFLAYCAGTGGSILIIGSASGIAVMGIQRISFGWYLRRFTLPALLGYAAGAVTFLVLRNATT